jgi:hypothetical protein
MRVYANTTGRFTLLNQRSLGKLENYLPYSHLKDAIHQTPSQSDISKYLKSEEQEELWSPIKDAFSGIADISATLQKIENYTTNNLELFLQNLSNLVSNIIGLNQGVLKANLNSKANELFKELESIQATDIEQLPFENKLHKFEDAYQEYQNKFPTKPSSKFLTLALKDKSNEKNFHIRFPWNNYNQSYNNLFMLEGKSGLVYISNDSTSLDHQEIKQLLKSKCAHNEDLPGRTYISFLYEYPNCSVEAEFSELPENFQNIIVNQLIENTQTVRNQKK